LLTVSESDAVESDTVAAQGVHPTYVQYVEGSADQAIYAATNGQMWALEIVNFDVVNIILFSLSKPMMNNLIGYVVYLSKWHKEQSCLNYVCVRTEILFMSTKWQVMLADNELNTNYAGILIIGAV